MSLYTALFALEQEKESLIKDMETKIRNQDKKINDYGQTVERLSIFNNEDIIEILTRLVSMYECEEYIPMTIDKDPVNRRKYLNGQSKSLIVIAKDSVSDLENIGALTLFIRNRVAIILPYYIAGQPIKFYNYNSEQKTIGTTFGTVLYPYVGEFLEEVISYRIENKLDTIDKSVLETLLESFISRNQKVIEEEQERKAMLATRFANISNPDSSMKLVKDPEE